MNEFGNTNAGYPAGALYVGQYHRSLRLAADALTDRPLIRIFSALHGLVDLDRPLHPYDVTIGDERAVTAERMAADTARLGLEDADVIFLGGQEYAALLAPSVPAPTHSTHRRHGRTPRYVQAGPRGRCGARRLVAGGQRTHR